jgi:hypothetical protein
LRFQKNNPIAIAAVPSIASTTAIAILAPSDKPPVDPEEEIDGVLVELETAVDVDEGVVATGADHNGATADVGMGVGDEVVEDDTELVISDIAKRPL